LAQREEDHSAKEKALEDQKAALKQKEKGYFTVIKAPVSKTAKPI
jgi:hypothetical protein